MKRLTVPILATLLCISGHAAKGPCVVSGKGFFRIHVGTGGLFGGFAHEHLIEAQKIEGCADLDKSNPAHSSIKLIFATAGLRVLDPKETEKDRADVQKTMETQ